MTAISRILSGRVAPAWTAISLKGLATPARLAAGATLPGVSDDRWSSIEAGGLFPCSVLHRIGFFVPPRSPSGRWALTPPFHPYLTCVRRYFFCDTFRHPQLSLKMPPAFLGRIILWCPDFPPPDKLGATALIPIKIVRDKFFLTTPDPNQTSVELTPSKSTGSKSIGPSTRSLVK